MNIENNKIGSTYGKFTSYKISNLFNSTKYFWQVVAKDNSSNYSVSDISWFMTSKNIQYNYPPYINKFPYEPFVAAETGINLWLVWNIWDPENQSISEIHLAKQDNKIHLLDSTTLKGYTYSTNWNFSDLESNTKYFWQIKTKEIFAEQIKETISPIWTFYTVKDGDNIPPVEPYNPYPAPFAKKIENNPVLSWESNDLDGNIAYNKIYWGKEADNFTNMIQTTAFSYAMTGLTLGSNYYWYVAAVDDKGKETKGPVWEFSVNAILENRPPHPPYNPEPKNASIISASNSVTLSWNGVDPDQDTVNYFVYLSYINKYGNDIMVFWGETGTAKSINVNLEENRVYSWQVVANENNWGIVVGPVWRFTTSSNM
ncbi:MAG: hypothetical protein HY934_10830 [Candidatus Firestonebacteria bacterium]|nr:hypothetical protein [Candidatus Firestonebacteria bacterium]